jgi:hypothetical protein
MHIPCFFKRFRIFLPPQIFQAYNELFVAPDQRIIINIK